MKEEGDKVRREERLKGGWNAVEIACVVLVVASAPYAFGTRPEVLTSAARLFYALTAFAGIIGAAGIVWTQWIRYRCRNDAQARQRYMYVKEMRIVGSVDVVKEDWSPLKRWSVMLLVGALAWGLFIGALLLFKK